MTDAAIISGSLVDVRNIGQDKMVKLSVLVPAEYAPKVMEAFGWPTNVEPVAVAVARLDLSKAKAADKPIPEKQPKSLGQLAAINCADPVFRTFLNEHKGYMIDTADQAAEIVRKICRVKSRKDIMPGTPAGEIWEALRGEYLAWRRV